MNNFIIISRTFTEVTPESAEHGDFSDCGFIDEKIEVSFGELVDLMTEHHNASQYPNNGSTDVWYSTSFFTTDYTKGISREESIHYHKDNTPNIEKYWRLAAKYAGLIR